MKGETFTMIRRTSAVLAATGLLALAACGSSSKSADAPATTAPAAATTAAPAAATTAAPAAATTAAPAAATTAAPAAATTAAPAAAGSYKTDPSWGGVAEATAGDKCGLGNGKKAEGTPVKIGSVSFFVAFKDGPNAMTAYIKCVNENGGIHGRPLQYISLDGEVDPAKTTAAASKLIDTEKVVAITGGFSLLDCPVNGKTYADKGYNIIVAGVPAECFGSPNIAATNMGPAYSAQGAAEAVIRAGAKGKLVHITGDGPGSEYNGTYVAAIAKQNGMEFEDMRSSQPDGATFADPVTVTLNAVKKAGKGGGVIITAVPPATLQILKAAEDQGLVGDVIWGSATPANDVSVAKAAPKSFDGKLLINAELAPLDSNGPDMKLIREVLAKYDTEKTPLGSFSQMGFLIGRIIVDTLNKMPAADVDDKVKVNAAIKAITNFKTDILCKPWYYGDGKAHVPNNWDLTVVPKDGVMVVKEKCFAITPTDPVLTQVRADEAAKNLNKG
jgi:branched-chain amino acid transport system substrate-binding protein